MYTCDVCGEEFETLTRLRLDHDPCPVEEERREHEQAIETVETEHGYSVGDHARLLGEGREVEVVDVEPGDDEPTVVWIDPDEDDTPENRERSPASDVL